MVKRSNSALPKDQEPVQGVSLKGHLQYVCWYAQFRPSVCHANLLPSMVARIPAMKKSASRGTSVIVIAMGLCLEMPLLNYLECILEKQDQSYLRCLYGCYQCYCICLPSIL